MNYKNFLKLDKSKTIKDGLLIASGVALISVAAVISATVYMSGKNLINDTTKEELVIISDSLSTSIRGYYDKMEASIKMIGADPNTIAAIKALNNEDGKILGDATKVNNAAVEELQRQLDAVKASDEAVLHAYLGTSKDKYQKSPVETYSNDYKASQRGWYTGAIQNGGMYWTEPYMDFSANKTCVTVGYPILDNGKVIGVLGFDLDLNYITDKFESLKIGEEGFYGLALPTKDGQFNVIYNSKDSLKESFAEKTVTENSNSDTEVAIPGLSSVLASAPKTYTSEAETKTVSINGTKYDVSAHNDENLGYVKIFGVEHKEWTSKTNKLLSIAAFASIIIGGAALFVISKIVSKLGKQMSDVNDLVSKLKEGDLTVSIDGDILEIEHEAGMLANNINETARTLNELINKINDASSSLDSVASEVSDSAAETNSRIEEIATTMSDITDGISKQAANAEDSNIAVTKLAERLDQLKVASSSIAELTEEVQRENNQVLKSVNTLKYYNDENNKSSQAVASNINELSKKAESIGSIVDTMSNIAEQTNILALNASIEAARAGDAGAGFSVLADEVKKLAQQSAKHAESIRDIVTAIQKDINSSVKDVENAISITEKQTEAVGSVVDAFTTISKSNENISESINDINGFVNVINADKDIIVSSVENIARVSQLSAASSQQISASVQEQTALTQSLADSAGKLGELSAELAGEIDNFKIK